MSIPVFFETGGLTHVVANGQPTIAALLPFAANFGAISFIGVLSLSYSMPDLAVRGAVVDSTGARPFVLTTNDKPVEAHERAARARLEFDAEYRSLILIASELRGSSWVDAEPQTVLAW